MGNIERATQIKFIDKLLKEFVNRKSFLYSVISKFKSECIIYPHSTCIFTLSVQCDSINLKIYEHEWRCKREFLFLKCIFKLIREYTKFTLYPIQWLTFLWLTSFYVQTIKVLFLYQIMTCCYPIHFPVFSLTFMLTDTKDGTD